MIREEWQRVRSLFESALEVDAADRPRFLEESCPDPATHREVESLLESHERAGTDFMGTPAIAGIVAEEEAQFRLRPGQLIGSYEILSEVAQGGMGAVYKAKRADGQYTQEVALKIVRAGFGSELIALRLRNERQILASLDHPNIARILDGGTTADGLPYYVMEFIDGLSITEYCDLHRLSVESRLELFCQVCAAVQYAHQRLIIHRDVKPSNILITPEGTPKLLDFGIAKVLDNKPSLRDLTMTAPGAWMMTPEYASPEQLRGESVTTSTDVYSLGLVLYELLTGRRAYRSEGRLPYEFAQVACETVPPKLSGIVLAAPATDAASKPGTAAELSALREATPAKLRRRLAGDLDNIVLMALRKEPSRRYTSVEQFAGDISRHLKQLPVVAQTDTLAYRASKFVRRHRVAVVASSVALILLLLAFVGTLYEARVASQQRIRAEQRFNDVRKVANSLIFEVHDSIRNLAGATDARKLILQDAQVYLDSLASESRSDPSLLRELAAAYSKLAGVQGDPRDVNLGDSAKALQNFRKSNELLQAAYSLQPSDRDIAQELSMSYLNLAPMLARAGDLDAGRRSLQKAVDILEPLAAANPDHQKIQSALGKAYEMHGGDLVDQKQFPAGLEDYRREQAIFERLRTADPKNDYYQREVSFAHKHIAADLLAMNDLPAALQQEQMALSIDEDLLARNPKNVQDRYNITYTYNDSGLILSKQGDYQAAQQSFEKALEIRTALSAADPQDRRTPFGMATSLRYMAGNLLREGDYPGSIDASKKALAILQSLAHQDPASSTYRETLAETEGRISEAYAMIAFHSRAGDVQPIKYCRLYQDWEEKGGAELAKQRAKANPQESDPTAVRVKASIDNCRQLLAGAHRTANSTSP
jgi:eukaryotic-like serine/threonine-protein kinase